MNGLVDEDDLQFEIPELPCGRTLCLELLSNWGDSKYIGLNAVEIFSDTGKRSEITKISTDASRSIGDVESIFVESFSCTDRSEMWRAEFEPNRCVRIEIEFVGRTRIAMIRFWNYSESRVHAQMGVRRLRAILDGFSIFDGEIDCAFTDHESEPMGETILFTTDESILESIAENDGCFEKSQEKNDYSRDITGDELALELTPDRPITREVNQLNSIKEKPTNITAPKVDDHKSIGKVKVLQLELCENWGAPGLIGLTGLELLDHNHDIIDPSTVTISSSNETQSDPKK